MTLAPGAPVDPATISDPAVPDYNYDMLSGVDYDIDISRPVGQRITRLQIAGTDTPVADDAQFVVAVNNYRRSGGGNFPGIVKTQVYNAQQEIRQLLIDWAQAKGAINPADFYVPNWRLVRDGVPVQFLIFSRGAPVVPGRPFSAHFVTGTCISVTHLSNSPGGQSR